jgi:hypothetical protein
LFPVTAFDSFSLRTGRLPCLHDIVERPGPIRQIVQEILLVRAVPQIRLLIPGSASNLTAMSNHTLVWIDTFVQ